MRNLDRRLRRLERTVDSDEAVLRAWEHAGRLYSDLSTSERELFCRYWRFGSHTSFEKMHTEFGWSLDFLVGPERKYTREQWAEQCAEVERLLLADD